ncbi:4-hydroxy-tetrahydrodipicolinate synthase [Herbaspirillum sp. Sphag1AN]|uniref:dihydrodipicolinate synthase family protein n=1 Tax=unclassified Herbaspirillum TaxID=2624150 RepID=UPI00160D36F3|nr:MULTISPECIES: dihydrodipicolinate synthase family protein [unclassified Herbaspirillum]MBB3211060.1 4-hydroxy-tetrahydrodipicolinate synthase [Herbaspirillum sp. Sphag1AN]MBB3244689.1 4-hydroxy-tetrahydrodipicolinate synthase [Herbaspirillum sp. Sphag64]
MSLSLSGVFAPVITPFHADLRVDVPLFVQHSRWLLGQGAGLAMFGTNSEANSLTVTERRQLLDQLLQADLDPARMLPGTGCCAIDDTVALTRHAVEAGCAGVLMLPPFYYKGVSDDGLYRYYAEVIQRVASARLKLYLYHIPAFTGVPITLSLIARLIKDFPETVVGIKDSSGDWDNVAAMLKEFPGFAIFPASESFLSRARPLGAAGCISATANVNPSGIARLCAQWDQPQGAQLQQQADAIRQTFQKYPMIAALKYATAHVSGNATWENVRPPLSPLASQQRLQLQAELAQIGFSMPGLVA